jgi:hypothetical protein
LKTINPLEYVDDEFQDIYRWIGIDMPAEAPEGDDEDRSSNSRGKQKPVEDVVVRFGFSLQSLYSRVDGFLVMLRMTNKSRTKLHLNLKHVKGVQYLTPLNGYLFFIPFKHLESAA